MTKLFHFFTLMFLMYTATSLATAQAQPHAVNYTKVYCSHDKSYVWHWLPSKRKAEGKWRRIYLRKYNKVTNMFFTTQDQYESLQAECENYYPHLPDARPANNFGDAWYTFAYYDVEGNLIITNKKVDMHTKYNASYLPFTGKLVD